MSYDFGLDKFLKVLNYYLVVDSQTNEKHNS